MNRIQRFLNGGGGGKNRPAKETMLIIFLSGILIFVIMLPTSSNNSSYSSKKNRSSSDSAGSGGAESAQGEGVKTSENALEQYQKGLESELADFLSSVAGVGAVKVLIYIKNSQEYIVEKDTPTSSVTNGENSELKKEESTVYTKNGSGDDVPFVAQTKSPSIDGVVVAAEGASDETVKLQIVRLVMALYGVEANKIEVLELGARP